MNDSASSSPGRWQRTFAASLLAMIAACGLSSPADGATAGLTDLAQSPIAANAAAQTKPNIMLLMDASGSMAWGHMPDEVEQSLPAYSNGQRSVGYKSAQCNVLYYNPLTTYVLPKKYDGAFFAQPSFNAAPYAGFVSFFAAPDVYDTSVVNLASGFVAYDGKTLRTPPTIAEVPQAAYYYVYSGAQTLTYASPACRQDDTGASAPAAGGGTWTRVLVGSGSGPGGIDERANFAVWYSFYRTRISLIKSAASLAFTPLTDSFRVGFITVEPKNDRTDPAINPARYVAIADFLLPQRDAWFRTLFAQPAFGSSPAREGLARVGRHYAGKQDGINNGMTGDPMQFSCQQNFTIMTTDGYWNAQTETPGAGPVKIDGITRVGQQDGTLSAPSGLTPRPIWEGFASDISVATDNVNQFSYAPCGAYVSMSTAQTSRSTSQLVASTSQLVTRTVQTKRSTEQISASTTQSTQSTQQRTASTSQTSQRTSQLRQSTSQLTRSTSQLQQMTTQLQQRLERITISTSQVTRRTSQLALSTSQLQSNTLQTRVATARVDQRTSQTTATTTQLVRSTAQLNVSTSQITRATTQQTASTLQQSQRTSQDRTCDSRNETCMPVATGTCSASGFFYCETVTTGPALVSSCTAATANSSNTFVTTTCTNTTTGPTPVASCTASAASSSNNFVATTCSPVSSGPVPVASCTASGASSANSWTATTCNTSTSALTPTGSCTTAVANAGNNYTATNCTSVPTGPVGVASCTAGPATSANAWTATTCNTINTGPTAVASCTNSSAGSGNSYVATTCNTVSTGPTPVSSCTASGASSGNSYVATTCTPVTTGPTPVASCTPSGGTSGNSWTTTTCPSVIGSPVGVASCTPAAGNSGNSYTATTCNTATTGPTGVASCTASGPTPSNGYVNTTCSTPTTGPTGVASCTPSGASSGNSYVATTCNTVTSGPTPTASCSVVAASAGNSFTASTCGLIVVQNWTNVGSCTPVAPTAGNTYTSTLCRTSNGAPTNVATCTASGPNGSGQGVACNTVTTGPTGVASCTPQTGSSGNGYMSVTCSTVTAGPTLVASCSPSAAGSGNAWTATTCSNTTTGPTFVASCAAQSANSGNAFTTTTCNTGTTGPTGVSACSPITAGPGNSYMATSCADVITGPTPVASCAAIPAASGNSWVATTCQTNATGPILVTACSPTPGNSGNGFITTSCSSALTGPTPVSSCTPSAAATGNSYVATTCATITSPDTGVASCTPVSATSGNSWTETQCATLNMTSGAASCTPSPAGSGNSWTSTSCNTATTGPTLTASCTPSPAGSGNSYLATSCNTVTTGPTSVASCTADPASAGNNFIATTCNTATGKKIQYATTTTVTTTQFSAGLQVGPPIVNASTGANADITGTCYAPGTEPPLPAPNPQRAGLAAGPNPPAGCSAWPCTTLTSNAGGSVDSLADVAQYYYATDLRPLMVDNVPAVGGGPEDDRATWQHMTTFTIGLGVSGTLNYRPDYKNSAATTGDFAEIRTGPRVWPVWPDPALNYDPLAGGSYANWSNPKSIDDFWHTAVNGRGNFFSAGDPRSVIAGLTDALAGVAERVGSGTGIAVSNSQPVTGDNFAYSPSYTTGKWIGDVQASEVDVSNGTVSTTINWSAAAKLDATVGAACDNRTIYLMRMGATDNKVNFSSNTRACNGLGNPTGPSDSGLNAAEMMNFGSANVSLFSQYIAMTDGTGGTVDQRTAAPGSNLVNFLRGQRGSEGFVSNDLSKLYRARASVLGDIVNGQPVYVKGPFASYQDAGYGAFKSANASRTPMLYVPANDGMLHAFYAGASSTDVQGGKEAWAFIPSAVLPNLYRLADNNYKNIHQFFVDGTPTIGDAFDGGAWKTILVGGLDAGGKSYYALDVTDPAAPKGLWEFKWSNVCYSGTAATAGADCHLGYTFGKPIISKLQDGTWVVMFASGYNNVNAPVKPGDGVGYVYVLNAFTGQIIYKISTGAGDSATPSGLAQLGNFVDYPAVNNTTRQLYGGDLLGNVWRIDVNDSIAPSGRDAALLGVAQDGGGNRQPITTRPELAELNAKPMVFIATGKLLGASDFADLQGQSVYGIVDPMTGGPVYPNLRSTFKPLAMTQLGSGASATRTVACTGTTAQCGSTDGWVVDLPDSGERVNVDMRLARGTLVFASNVPSNNACTTGGYSWLNFLNFSSGLAVTTSANLSVSVQSSNSLATGLNLLDIQGRLIGVRRFTDGTNLERDPVPFDTPGPVGKRISWREIAQ